jgi:hypothetical protein
MRVCKSETPVRKERFDQPTPLYLTELTTGDPLQKDHRPEVGDANAKGRNWPACGITSARFGRKPNLDQFAVKLVLTTCSSAFGGILKIETNWQQSGTRFRKLFEK